MVASTLALLVALSLVPSIALALPEPIRLEGKDEGGHGNGDKKTIKYWFSFGDSYTETGFNIAGTKPTVNNSLGNPAYPGWTGCGALPNWVDYEATIYKGDTPLEIWNWAKGGATITRALAPPSQGVDMTDEVNSFLTNVAPKSSYVQWSAKSSLFTFFIGINDIITTYSNPGDRYAFTNTLLDAYFNLVFKTYDAGGRNYVFFPVPPIERTPKFLATSASTQALIKSLVEDYNTKLIERVASFKKTHHAVKTHFFNITETFTMVLNNPTKYGVIDSTSYGDATKDAWCNDFHPSPPIHNVIAKEVADFFRGINFFL